MLSIGLKVTKLSICKQELIIGPETLWREVEIAANQQHLILPGKLIARK